MQQIGTCVVYKRHGCYPAARCLECDWNTEVIYEDDLACRIADHSNAHRGPAKVNVTSRVTINGEPVING